MSGYRKPRVRVFVGDSRQRFMQLDRIGRRCTAFFPPHLADGGNWLPDVTVIDRGSQHRKSFPHHWRHADDDPYKFLRI